MKIQFTIELGNDAMQTPREVADAIRRALSRRDPDKPLTDPEAAGVILDVNGNRVGRWECFP
jgi:hypothetical protein